VVRRWFVFCAPKLRGAPTKERGGGYGQARVSAGGPRVGTGAAAAAAAAAATTTSAPPPPAAPTAGPVHDVVWAAEGLAGARGGDRRAVPRLGDPRAPREPGDVEREGRGDGGLSLGVSFFLNSRSALAAFIRQRRQSPPPPPFPLPPSPRLGRSVSQKIHDEGVFEMPLKYQMAWLCNELDLTLGFGAGAHTPRRGSSTDRGGAV